MGGVTKAEGKGPSKILLRRGGKDGILK